MITVRQAKESDANELLRVASRFPIESYLHVIGVARLVTDPNVCLLLVYAEGQAVGYLLAYDRHRHPRFIGLDAAQIEEVMVSEDFRDRRIGRLLMERFEDWARDRQCRVVDVGGAPAAGFYRALGYEQSGIRLQKNLGEHEA